MDGVIFRDVNFWLELHKKFGTFKEGKQLTEKYLYTNYDKLVQEVVGRLWKGKDAKPYYSLVKSLKYLPGVAKTFKFIKEQGLLTAIISASSIEVARRVQHDHGVDYLFANELVIKDNKVTGEFLWPIAHAREKKAEIIHHLCEDLDISPEEVIYVGDSRDDIEAFKEVGLSIAFNSQSKELKEVASQIVEDKNLTKIIPLISD